ncbi:MAG: tetratricopeptide repeat protein [Chthoniobacterales bacterium]|nr:tetratricopeptide repeat protein [Chthoniobacterales bacterium]
MLLLKVKPESLSKFSIIIGVLIAPFIDCSNAQFSPSSPPQQDNPQKNRLPLPIYRVSLPVTPYPASSPTETVTPTPSFTQSPETAKPTLNELIEDKNITNSSQILPTPVPTPSPQSVLTPPPSEPISSRSNTILSLPPSSPAPTPLPPHTPADTLQSPSLLPPKNPPRTPFIPNLDSELLPFEQTRTLSPTPLPPPSEPPTTPSPDNIPKTLDTIDQLSHSLPFPTSTIQIPHSLPLITPTQSPQQSPAAQVQTEETSDHLLPNSQTPTPHHLEATHPQDKQPSDLPLDRPGFSELFAKEQEEYNWWRARVQDMFQMAQQLAKLPHPNGPQAQLREVEKAYVTLLSYPLTFEEQERALFELGNYLLEQNGNLVKAAAVFEQYLTLNPASDRAPDVNMKLGEIYERIGVTRLAINKYYDILAAAMRMRDASRAEYFSRQAMLKIANAKFEQGAYLEAAQFYSRLKLLSLSPQDQELVLFRAVQLLYIRQQYQQAIETAYQFLSQYPQSEFSPDCRQILIRSLNASGKLDEAIQQTLELLRTTQTQENDPLQAAFWKMKIGNDLANILYTNREFTRALQIYQNLAALNRHPAWRLPVVYQIGLTFEKLNQFQRAIQAYNFIANSPLPNSPQPPTPHSDNPDDKPVLPSEDELKIYQTLESLRDLARWRADTLQWMLDTAKTLHPLLADQLPIPQHNHTPNPTPSPTQ